MKTWKLTEAREYKLISDEDIESTTASNEPFTETVEATIDNDSIKVKLTKANLSSVDMAYYKGKINTKKAITPARSGTALVSECNDHMYDVGQRVFLSPYETNAADELLIKSYNTDGYLSDFVVTSRNCVYPIPEGVGDNEVLFTEDIALCIACFNKLNIDRGQYIALYGASYLNCIFAQLAIYYQAIPIIIDNDEDRLNIASNLGVYYTINTNEENAERKALEITSGNMFDLLIVDADSFPKADDGLNLIKNEGSVGVYGYSKSNVDIQLSIDKILQKGLQVVGVNNGAHEIHSAINLLANKAIKIDYLIEDETPFSNFIQIMKNCSDRANIFKHVITFN